MTQPQPTYWHQIKSLFTVKRHTGAEAGVPIFPAGLADPGPTAEPREGASGTDIESITAFDQRLKTLATQRNLSASLMAGKVHVLNLAKVRDHMGAKWPKYSDRVHSVIKTELDRRLARHDLFSRISDDTYVIVFGECSDVEARLKIALLSEQILAKLFGEAEAKDLEVLSVETLVTKADGEIASQALQSAESLIGLLEQADITELSVDSARYNASSDSRALSPQEVAKLLGDVESHLRSFEAAPAAGDDPQIQVDRLRTLVRLLEELEQELASQDLPTRPASRADNYNWVEFQAPAVEAIRILKSRAERQAAFVDSRTTDSVEYGQDELALNVEFRYLPMWQASNEKVGLYRCQPSIEMGAETDLGSTAGAADVEVHLLATLDRIMLRKAREDLRAVVAQGQRVLIAVPLHFSTLKRKSSLQAIHEICSNIPEDVRQLLLWEVVGAEAATWKRELPVLIDPLKRYVRAVFLLLDDPQGLGEVHQLPHLAAAGVMGVGADAASLPGGEMEKLAVLSHVAKEAGKSGLKCFAHGLDTVSLVLWAIGAGYQHMSGAAIGACVPRPEGIMDKPLSSLYAGLAPS